MQVRALSVPGAFEVTPRRFPDDRGVFLEWFKDVPFVGATGHPFSLAQANLSVSRRGTLRGVHVGDVPPGQAKYVMCVSGAVRDVVVDLRVGSPAFGQWDAVLLDDVDRRAVYVPEGVGHGFAALQDDSVVVYLCSVGYDPGREHGVHPLDGELAIDWGLPQAELVLSDRDAAAPGLADAMESLPTWAACEEHLATLVASARPGGV
jgi:dTDP-4-dehydrorhamnose 3,5-epimerase